MTWRKALATSVVLTIIGGLLVGSLTMAKEPYTVAVVLKTLNNPFFIAMKEQAEKKGKELGANVVVLAPPQETDIERQISMVEDQIQKRVSAIVVCPCGTKEIVPAIEQANQVGIPILTVDTKAEGGKVETFIGTNNYLGGKLAGEFIVKELGGQGNVAIIMGTPGNQTHEDRVAGFKDAVASHKGIKIVTIQPAHSERALGMSVAENILTAHPNLDAIYCTNDEMVLGTAEAVGLAGKRGKIVLIGFDGAPEVAQAILDGKVTATIAQAPGRMGALSVEYALKVLKGEKIPAVIDTGTGVVTKANAKEYLQWH